MKCETVEIYRPRAEHVRVYDELYREYKILYEYFGKTEKVMQRLRSIRKYRNN